jgi:hypothetical protein
MNGLAIAVNSLMLVGTTIGVAVPPVPPDNVELREDGGYELREDGGLELRE